jgi:hypothetical protein
VSDLEPTHSCFDDAVQFFIALGTEGTPAEQLDKFVLVHGICLAPDDTPYVHAWVEHADDFVVMAGIVEGKREYYKVERGSFYENWRVQEFTVYTVDEFVRACAASRGGTAGPWLPKYIAMQNRDRKSKGPRKWRIGEIVRERTVFNTLTGEHEDAP